MKPRVCEHDFDPLDRCQRCRRTAEQVYRGEISGHHDPGRTTETWELVRRLMRNRRRS